MFDFIKDPIYLKSVNCDCEFASNKMNSLSPSSIRVGKAALQEACSKYQFTAKLGPFIQKWVGFTASLSQFKRQLLFNYLERQKRIQYHLFKAEIQVNSENSYTKTLLIANSIYYNYCLLCPFSFSLSLSLSFVCLRWMPLMLCWP